MRFPRPLLAHGSEGERWHARKGGAAGGARGGRGLAGDRDADPGARNRHRRDCRAFEPEASPRLCRQARPGHPCQVRPAPRFEALPSPRRQARPRLRRRLPGLRRPDEFALEREAPVAHGPLEPPQNTVSAALRIGGGPCQDPCRQPPGQSVALTAIADQSRAHLEHRPGAPRPSPVCGYVAVESRRPVRRRWRAGPAADPPGQMLVLEVDQPRDEGQVAVAIAAAPVGAAEARRDGPPFSLDDQERGAVRADPGSSASATGSPGILTSMCSARTRSKTVRIRLWSSGGMSSGGTAAGSVAVSRCQPDAKRRSLVALMHTFPRKLGGGLPGGCLPNLPYESAGSASVQGSVRLRPSNDW